MPQIGPLEILVVGVLALIVFGPERLPEIGRSLGKGFNQMKKMASDVKADFDLGLEEETTAAKPTPETDVAPVVDPVVDPVVVNDDSVPTAAAKSSSPSA